MPAAAVTSVKGKPPGDGEGEGPRRAGLSGTVAWQAGRARTSRSPVTRRRRRIPMGLKAEKYPECLRAVETTATKARSRPAPTGPARFQLHSIERSQSAQADFVPSSPWFQPPGESSA